VKLRELRSLMESRPFHSTTGDPILIYYAGHGGLADTPMSWEAWSTSKITLLVPYDHSSPLVDGNPIHGIPDRTLRVLLSQLVIVKGDNITVVLDCGYSGGFTHGGLTSHVILAACGSESLFLSGARGVDPLRMNYSASLRLLESTISRTLAYSIGCHVCLGKSRNVGAFIETESRQKNSLLLQNTWKGSTTRCRFCAWNQLGGRIQGISRC